MSADASKVYLPVIVREVPLQPTPLPTPGLMLSGHVYLNEDSAGGLGGVAIYRAYSSYSGDRVATTRADGCYQAEFAYIPGDEMVRVWAEIEGHTFDPEQYQWRHYGGYEELRLDFVAQLTCPEPANSTRQGACGPLVAGAVYREHISSDSDEYDWFYSDMPAARTIEAWLTDIPPGCDYDLYLTNAAGDLIQDSANGGNQDERIVTGTLPAGRYYLVVARIEGWNASVSYALRVDY